MTRKKESEAQAKRKEIALKKGLSIDVLDSDLSPDKANYRPISVNREKLIRVFSFPPEVENKDQEVACWDYFATSRPQSTLPSNIAKFVSSVEEPHNNLHNDIGGNGNMSSLEMAGYDPIFFLHHCNIDRLYALWEYVYPDYWMGKDGYAVDKDTRKQFEDTWGTYQGKPGAAITESTGLAPFRTSAGEYWTSNDVRGLTPAAPVKKYYSYPPVKVTYEKRHGWFDTLGDVPVSIDVTKPCTLDERKQYIAALQYHFGARPTLLLGPGPALPPIFRGVPPEETPQLPGGKAVDGTRDFVVVVTLPQFAFRGSHRLELYLGGVYVGDVSVFSRTKPEKCKNCASNIASGTAVVRGVVCLPHNVVVQVLEKADANKDTTTEEEIVQILKDNLVGRIVRPDRTLLAHGESGFVTGPGPDDQTQWINQRSVGLGTYALQQSRQTISIAHYPVLPNKNEPTLEIHSARVVVSENEFVPPVRTDVISHGAALGGEWRRWHAGADSDSD